MARWRNAGFVTEPQPKEMKWKRVDPSVSLEAERARIFEKGSDYRPAKRSDIVGVDEVLMRIDDVIHWLAHFSEYQKHGSRLEPGILFSGEPGTGKTLISRYIATQSNALFVSVRDWPHTKATVTDSDIADLFAHAREFYGRTHRPVLIFWDEFEGAAGHRHNVPPEQQAAISQLTSELDGIHGKNEGLLLIGCTNFPDGIDDALLRSGRMGLHIEFSSPDRDGKKEILRHHLSTFSLEGEIDYDTVSHFLMPGATAADIEESCYDAWRVSVQRAIEISAEPSLSERDLLNVFVQRLVGPPSMFVTLPHERRRDIALHEVGHALVALGHRIPLHLVTVYPGRHALGRTIVGEIEDRIGYIEDYKHRMRIAFGGKVAEDICGIRPSAGTKEDFEKICEIAVQLVDSFGTGEVSTHVSVTSVAQARGNLGGISEPNPNVSADAIFKSDQDIRETIHQALEETREVLTKVGRDRLWKLADFVNTSETLTGRQFLEYARTLNLDFPEPASS